VPQKAEVEANKVRTYLNDTSGFLITSLVVIAGMDANFERNDAELKT